MVPSRPQRPGESYYIPNVIMAKTKRKQHLQAAGSRERFTHGSVRNHRRNVGVEERGLSEKDGWGDAESLAELFDVMFVEFAFAA